jgi:hypothetical protein
MRCRTCLLRAKDDILKWPGMASRSSESSRKEIVEEVGCYNNGSSTHV